MNRANTALINFPIFFGREIKKCNLGESLAQPTSAEANPSKEKCSFRDVPIFYSFSTIIFGYLLYWVGVDF
jgi:hypothetical protein